MNSKDDKNIEEKDRYNLYTERIVEKPSVKYKKIIKAVRIAAEGVLFGSAAAFAFIVLCRHFNAVIGVQYRNSRPGIVIGRDEYPSGGHTDTKETESATQEPVSAGPGGEEPGTHMTVSVQSGVEAASRTIVRVSGKQEHIVNPFEEGDIFSAGVIFAEIDSEYLILTQYDEVNRTSGITVQFGDNSEVRGYYVKGDADIGIAIISVKESDMAVSARSFVRTAELGNSFAVEQGETVIAAGHVIGQDFSVNIGVVTSLGHRVGLVDNYVGLINTNMLSSQDDHGFLFDLSGSLIGIPSGNAQSAVMEFFGISDLKALIENLSNGYNVTYCGIIGENITQSMSDIYGLPVGVYIIEVRENSPAYEAGLQAGDIITSINDETALTFGEFSEKIYRLKSGNKATINVKRLGRSEYRDILFGVTLGSRD